MKPKKSPKADLENKKSIFLLVGLVLSLGFIWIVFNINSSVKNADSLGEAQLDAVVEDDIPITQAPQTPPPPPPPPPATVEIINIVDNTVEIDDDLDIEDSEADAETAVEVAPVVEKKEEVVDEAQVFVSVEQMPEFPGGQMALMKYLGSHVKYPSVAQENGIQGVVVVQFVVNTDGSVTDARVLRPVDPALDKEALRVVNSMPKWKPGKQGGKTVRVSYTVPINFQLR